MVLTAELFPLFEEKIVSMCSSSWPLNLVFSTLSLLNSRIKNYDATPNWLPMPFNSHNLIIKMQLGATRGFFNLIFKILGGL